MKKEIVKYAFINSILTALYIALVSSVLFYGKNFETGPDTVLMPMMMIMLFVFSATITAALVLGRPVLWYLDGKKREAVSLLLYTILIFFVLLVSVFIVVLK